jgi:Leucine-rich repeat (LRR) protein
MLILPNNKLKTLPSEIGNLKNLKFINIFNNQFKTIPEDIKYLDKSNGGSLHRIVTKRSDIGELNYNNLIKFLPNTLL